MDFFNKMGETITSKSKDVARKAKDITEIAKLSGQIGAKEAGLNEVFQEIGRMVYEQKSEWFNQKLSEKCSEADTMFMEIERLKKEVLELKGMKQCPKCGEEVDEEAVFCPKCGAQMPVPEPVKEEEAQAQQAQETAENAEKETKAEEGPVCPGCGKHADPENLFCPGCGAKLKAEEAK